MKLLDQTRESLGLLDRVEIFALNVFDEHDFERRFVRDPANYRRDARQARPLCCTPAALTREQLKSHPDWAQYKRLNDASGLNRLRELGECLFAEVPTRLIGARLNQIDVDELRLSDGSRGRNGNLFGDY